MSEPTMRGLGVGVAHHGAGGGPAVHLTGACRRVSAASSSGCVGEPPGIPGRSRSDRIPTLLAAPRDGAVSETSRGARCLNDVRTWSLALLAVGGACVPAPPAPPAPPLPRLATPGHLFLISTEDVAAHCQRWDVVPSVGGQGQLVREIDISGEAGVDTIDYHLRVRR
ncbi:MAG: hypothetical protein R3B06_04540 [Kofleriaceae bacterium]